VAGVGHRKIWALLRADGLRLGSQATVLRALRRRGLIQPPGALRERRELARQRREAFIAPVLRRNRVWQFDFSEFETAGGGTWNLGGLVDYHGKLALTCPVTATKTHRDAIAALEVARDRVSDLLGRPLAQRSSCPSAAIPAPWCATGGSRSRRSRWSSARPATTSRSGSHARSPGRWAGHNRL